MRVAVTYALLWLALATAVAAGVLVGSLLAGTVAASRSAPESTVSPRSYDGLPSALARSGQPESHPGAPTTQIALGRITPSPATGKRPAPAEAPPDRITLRGIATWFASPSGVSAAGPDLRAALGPGWRGTRVRVCAGDRCVATVLGDWCACGSRPGGPTVIDLDDNVFARLSSLDTGVLPIEVRW